ncbi:MAG: CRTAC1 family protein [Victivallaceae bacterium]|nr:CRTAC1 family protein [Victivallaceae bacterium]
MKILNLLISVSILFVMCSCVARQVEFRDVTQEVGLAKLGNRKAAWADLNNDGWPDLISDGKIWRNFNGGNFIDVTAASGIAPVTGACVVADFNGDGRKDIYFVAKGGTLYLGNGDFKFIKGRAAKNAAPVSRGACAADLDNDGYVDIYVANYEIWKQQLGFADIILRNDKGSLVRQWEAPDEKILRGRGVTACDFNNDGRMDIYVSNYRLMPNFLWVNAGGWKIEDKAREYGCAGTERRDIVFKNCKKIPYGCSGHTIGSLWADFNNDTYFDLFVGNFSHPPLWQDRPMLLRNSGPRGKYRFIDESSKAGLPWQESYCSPAAADVDNDGLVDIFFSTVYPRDTGRLFRNEGAWKFKDLTLESAIRERLSYQNAFADFDNDGRIDLLTGGRLYRNIGAAGNWLEITLQGKAPNTSAVGARVIVECGDEKYVRQVEAGTGEGNQNDLRLHFGIGRHRGPVNVKVIWPDGKITNHVAEANTAAAIKQK